MSAQEKKLTQKQKDIISAATILFAEKGYAATSTYEIAKKAGVAEGTIFRHYKTKKDLLLAIVSPMMVELIAPIVKADIYQVLEKDFEHLDDFIKAIIQNRIVFIKNNIALIRILFQELPFQPELKKKFITHIGNDVFVKVKKVIQHYQDKDQIIDLPPATIIRTFVATILSFILMRHVILPEADWDDETEVEDIIHIIKHGISPTAK